MLANNNVKMVVTMQNNMDGPQKNPEIIPHIHDKYKKKFTNTDKEVIENRIPKRNLHTCVHCILHSTQEVEVTHQEVNGQRKCGMSTSEILFSF